MDPDFIHELFVQKSARNDHELLEGELEPKKRERKEQQRRNLRKTEIVKMKDKPRGE